MIKRNKAIFLDRDGVINKEVNYLHKIKDFEFTKNCIDALLLLQQQGYLLFIITNQAGIGRGYYNEADFHILNNWMLLELKKHGVNINDVRFCPHHAKEGKGTYKIDCECRKPKIGMITPLIEKYNIDVHSSILIGDKVSDIEAGKAANIDNLILVKSGHTLPENIPKSVSAVHESLATFAESLPAHD